MFSSNIPLPALKAAQSPDSGAQTVRATAGALYFGLNAEKELLTIRDNGGNLPGACFFFFPFYCAPGPKQFPGYSAWSMAFNSRMTSD